MSVDPTAIDIRFDPREARMQGTTVHGNIYFDAPFISQIDGNLWQGGCATGLVLPSFIEHVVSLYPWEKYTINHELKSVVYVRMYDSTSQGFEQVEELARLVNECCEDGPTLVNCFPPGTLVGAPTPVAIEEAFEVFGHDGALHKVVAHHERYFKGELIHIRTTGAHPIKCTPEHPFLVVRPYYFPGGFMAKPGMHSLESVRTVIEHYASQPVWLKANEIREGDFLVSAPLVTRNPPAPIQWPKGDARSRVPSPLVPNADTAWMLGFYAADGGTMGKHSISFALSLKDDEARLLRVWNSMGIAPTVRKYDAYKAVTINSTIVSDAFSKWFKKGVHKQLPDFIFRDSWPLESVVEGYAAGDGYVTKRGAVACRSISKLLIEQIRCALVACGESPTVSAIQRSSGYPNAKPISEIQWSPTATQHHSAWWRGHYLLPVTELRRERYEGMVYNLAVEDAETFTVNGVVVHNCQAGLNRSGLVAARALMLRGMSGAEAIALLREKRSPACLCNPAFERWILEHK